MKMRVFGLVILLAVFVSACTPPPNLLDDKFLQDTSLLTGEPCDAPCWRGIIPGVTTWNDALTIIEDSADLVNIQQQSVPESSARLVDFDAKDGVRCCRMYSDDGKVVSSMLTLLAPQTTFGDVVEKYGQPQYFTVESVTDDQALVSVLFNDVPMILYVFGAGVANGEISATSQVIGVIYLTQSDMESVLKGSSLYLWTGNGKLAELADGTFDVTPAPESTAEATAEATSAGDQ